MKFKYKRYAPKILRPVIPITIEYKEKKINYEVLIDSGADLNIIDAEIGDLLGINIASGKKSIVLGITGSSETYYIHTVNLIVGGHKYSDINVGFLRNIGRQNYGVLGQNGFFDLFTIKFNLLKEEVEIKPNNA